MLYSKLQSRNDSFTNKRNDAAAFYQQATISLAKNQMLVVEFPSKPISSWLRKNYSKRRRVTNLDDAVLDMPHRYQLLVNQQESILHNDSKPAVALNQTTSLRLYHPAVAQRKLLLLVSIYKTVLATRHSLVDPFNCARQPPAETISNTTQLPKLVVNTQKR
ncbi:hypothetical protein F511_03981 [Dorcoceras hygrometricum]|uniref:Uncharacterized protein n=1 Tax=Dorcoceras hygrometricum TaxID=472368 RepID=A0A2Z7D751_9LAMI|nr:hypothetical protein F511_03981 [Dorcoceras hygrometricum]